MPKPREQIAERTGDVKKTSWRFTKSLHSLFSLFDVHLLGTKVESCSAHVIVSQRHAFDPQTDLIRLQMCIDDKNNNKKGVALIVQTVERKTLELERM